MIFLNDNAIRKNLFPLTHTRHAACIRIGILTVQEKWEFLLGQKVHLQKQENEIEIPANIIPTAVNFEKIIEQVKYSNLDVASLKQFTYPWDIFKLNDFALREDFEMLTLKTSSKILSETNILIGEKKNIFIGENVNAEHCLFNTTTGPIYIDDGATIQEGSIIRGPFYLGKNSIVKIGAKIYGATSIGHHCIVGGEIKNSVIQDYSNKAHDGYLGDSVLGSWCNLGAGTSNSNVKNTAGDVKMKIKFDGEILNAGIKAGLIMGDYSRAAINTSFNTGTVVGVCCNIFGEKYPPKFIDNFTWGNEYYDFEKAMEHIENWMQLKNNSVSEEQKQILKNLYSQKK